MKIILWNLFGINIFKNIHFLASFISTCVIINILLRDFGDTFGDY